MTARRCAVIEAFSSQAFRVSSCSKLPTWSLCRENPPLGGSPEENLQSSQVEANGRTAVSHKVDKIRSTLHQISWHQQFPLDKIFNLFRPLASPGKDPKTSSGAPGALPHLRFDERE
jgi:hypothetical protein